MVLHRIKALLESTSADQLRSLGPRRQEAAMRRVANLWTERGDRSTSCDYPLIGDA